MKNLVQLNRKLLVVVIYIIIILVGASILFPAEDDDTGSSSVTLIIDFGDNGNLFEKNHTIWKDGHFLNSTRNQDNTTIYEFQDLQGENQSVFAILEKAAVWGNFTFEYSDYPTQDGVFIDAIAGVENEQASWEYYVNGEYGVQASDLNIVNDGDVITWEYL